MSISVEFLEQSHYNREVLPLKDENPSRGFPFVNISLIVLNIVVFLYELSLGGKLNLFFLQYGLIPYEVIKGIDIPPKNPFPVPVNFFTSMFIHGGFMHIAGNMLYLWIFGDNVEDALGHFGYLLFYLITGLIASVTQIFLSPLSKIPTVGASGAISGVLGGYFLLYPTARVLTLVPDFFTLGLFYRMVRIPAFLVLGGWFLIQFFYGFLSFGKTSTGGVAWFAHIGGFVAGLLLIRIFLKRRGYR